MKKIRVGVVGVGVMGNSHARQLLEGQIARAELTAVSDSSPQRLQPFKGRVQTFTAADKMLRSGLLDAVIIASPHYDHTISGRLALQQGLHVLVEKPISVHKADCQRLLAAHRSKRQVFAAMFNNRTLPCYAKLRQLVAEGELGALRRIVWITTDWFRTDTYYAMGGWRATWRGEGGGVLMNQCPHQLDLLQWIAGLPARLRAFCYFGKYHSIEVEDDVTAYLEYANGATGVFIATTGEAPGTNRLELTGDRGRVIVEHEKIRFTRNTTPMDEYCRKSPEAFGKPDVWQVEIPASAPALIQHRAIIQNFVDAILDKVPLIAPAAEGIHSVELANAMIYSSIKDQWVDLPLNAASYERLLKELIKRPPARWQPSGRRSQPRRRRQ
ncbi:MAG: Gfo/Idh/MocA family oxidoreductase [Lentisphaerae bacterium]|nr:Gfo/Idh/MocA family oxidoreductase [Lentisphaerota bacterium]